MIARLMGLKTISPGKLDELVRQRAVTVIDVNSPGSWAQSHVPGAVNLDPMNFSESDLPPEKSSPLAFYCSNPFCRKAPNAARRAGKMGYADVRVMSAGISGWIAANLPTEAGAQVR
jgi:rhodanese-related sulfurtransferase